MSKKKASKQSESAAAKRDFEGQRPGEEVLFVFRRHIIAMRKGFYGLLIPFAISSLPVLIWQDSLELLWSPVIGFTFGSLLFFYHWIGWYYSIFVVTNQRIEQTSQTGLFGKSVIDLSLSKIQNISYNIPGFTGEIFGFGTIVLQTYVGDMILDKVHKPGETYNKIQHAIYENRGKLETQHEELPQA
jgi:hypothetical protein